MTISLSNLTTNGVLPSDQTIDPFASVSLTDTLTSDQVSATISFTAANGVLSGAGLSARSVTGGVARYTLTATSAASLQSELRALVFAPTTPPSSPGAVATTFSLALAGTPPAAPILTLPAGPDTKFLATDGAGDIFVANTGYEADNSYNYTVQEYDSSGTLLRNLMKTPPRPIAIGTDLTGNVYLAVEDNPNTISKYSPSGDLLYTITLGVNTLPAYLVTDAAGNLFAGNVGDNTVVEYSASGNLLHTFTYAANGINEPVSLATDAAGDLFVVNYFGYNVEEFSASGDLLRTLDLGGAGNPYSIATDAAGDVFVANGVYNNVLEFSASGVLLRTLTTGVNSPIAVATDAAGDLFVANFKSETVEEFSASGDLLRTLSVGISKPDYLATDAAGDVFVSNRGNGTVVEFAPLSQVLDSTTKITTTFAPPTITGTIAKSTTTSEAPVTPFANVTVGDVTPGATETLTITLSGAGGTLSGQGLTGTGGVYTLTGSAASVTSRLDALTFTPNAGAPLSKNDTIFSLSDISNAHGAPATTATTTVTDIDLALVVSGFTQTTARDDETVHPFATVTVTDTVASDPVSATVSYTAANGTLSGAGLSGPTVVGGVATYTLAPATAANLQSELRGIVFTPTPQQVAPGVAVTTTFTLAATDPLLTPIAILTSGVSAPIALATDAAGDVFVANSGNGTVGEFSPLGALLQTIAGLRYPRSVATDAAGHLYEADGGTDLVKEYSASGVLLTTVYDNVSGPYSVTTDAAGDIFVASFSNNSVEEFSAAGALTRTLLNGISEPVSVATDAAGNLFVANVGNNTVQEFSATGTLLRTLSSGISGPNAVVTDAAGDVFVANSFGGTVEKFSAAGDLLMTLSEGVFDPRSVALDAAGNIFAPSYGHNNVEEFSASGVLLRTLTTGVEYPVAVATDAAGDVFVANFVMNTVTEYAPLVHVEYAATVVTTTAACFLAGTRIATQKGLKPVETLRVGDMALTQSGAMRPIVWIGRRALRASRHPEPAQVWPYRITANAFGPGLPLRDLWLSPEHNIAWEGGLMSVKRLANGLSVAQVERDQIEYWHVELDTHDILFSEGLASESYLDTSNRTAFENGGAYMEAHPDFRPRHWADTCLPLVFEGPSLVSAKARLIERLAAQGFTVDAEADPHVEADGERITARMRSEGRLIFIVPEGRREILLKSQSFVPAHSVAHSIDVRRLGLCVARLEIDGQKLDLTEALGTGWWAPEFVESCFSQRSFSHIWTDGAVLLPFGVRRVVVDLGGQGNYWRAPEQARGCSVSIPNAGLLADVMSSAAR